MRQEKKHYTTQSYNFFFLKFNCKLLTFFELLLNFFKGSVIKLVKNTSFNDI